MEDSTIAVIVGCIIATCVILIVVIIGFGAAIEQQYIASKWDGRAFILEKNNHDGQYTSGKNGFWITIKLINGHIGTYIPIDKAAYYRYNVGDQINVTCQKGIYGMYDVVLRD